MTKRKAAARHKAMTKKSKKVVAVSKDCSNKTTAAAQAAAASAASKPAASAPCFATPTASASAVDAAAFAKFSHREYSKKYHRNKPELMRGGFSKDDAAARSADAARQHIAALRHKREEKLHS